MKLDTGKNVFWVISLFVVLLTSGCSVFQSGSERKLFKIGHVKVPVYVDGKLDESAWKSAPSYPMALSSDPWPDVPPAITRNWKKALAEKATVKLITSQDYVYIGVECVDNDVFAGKKATKSDGDVIDVFLKPERNLWYWQFQLWPNSVKKGFFWPSRGRRALFGSSINLKNIAASKIEGTLNKWRDTDSGWSAEIAIPITSLTACGDHFGPGSDWLILVGRHNYSKNLSWPEISSCPAMPSNDFHLYENYGKLDFSE